MALTAQTPPASAKTAASSLGESERVTLLRPAGLPGVELWSVRRSIRPWPAFHTTYVFCTPDRLDHLPHFRCRGITHRLGPTSTILLEPGELHVATEIPSPADLHFLLVTPEMVERTLGELGRGDGQARLHFPHPQVDDPALVGSFGRLRQSIEHPVPDTLEQKHYFSCYLRALVERAAQVEAPVGESSRCLKAIEHVRALVEARFAQRLTLDDLARETGFSKFYLERSFNDRFGLPIHQFLKRVRIARALALLRQGERPAAVAKAVGFADQPHLTRVFRSELGFTPRQYWAAARPAARV